MAASDGHAQVFATGSGLVRQNWFAPANGAVGGWNSFWELTSPRPTGRRPSTPIPDQLVQADSEREIRLGLTS
ncbi:hypothetical protein [Amycolatopsis magusensis]|uniref:hypothetical protein n=1 Tax=Amycolatopsis magusensis TaxID=882444 RepID=UPI0024A99725|nr:hypothetical protein [Amycolatopsis magusensis]MDI5977899.1 hypothetical protein [Amycolatopsis magusensis]